MKFFLDTLERGSTFKPSSIYGTENPDWAYYHVTIPFHQTRTSSSNGKQVELQGRLPKPANHFSQHEILQSILPC